MRGRQVVIAGGGLAALRAAEGLRRHGFDGGIVMACQEHTAPYDRPPLSKAVLTGSRDPESTIFRSGDDYDELEVELVLGQPATRVDLRERAVLVGERWVDYSALIICTGANARQLPCAAGLAGVHTLRTIDDARRVRALLEASPRVVVVGAGFIGSEVASSARSLSLDVVVVDAESSPLTRVLGATMGKTLSDLHRDAGADLRCGVQIVAVEGGDRVERIVLSDGTQIECDLLVVGIGVEPNIDWLRGGGLTLDNGIVCDATLNAGAPDVYAAGDVVSWPNPLFGVRMRCEQWTNAVEQARHVARAIATGDTAHPYAGSNYFWTDQYGVRIQFAGLAQGDAISVVRGSPRDRKFLAWYRSGDRLVGALAMDEPKLLMQSKMLIEDRSEWSRALAALPA